MEIKKYKGIILMIICTIFTAIGQFFIKTGVETLTLNLFSIITNYSLIFGLFLYGFSGIILVFALKQGELNVIYPMISLSYIWTTLISIFLLNEYVSGVQITGISAVLLGVFFITNGEKK